MSAVSLLLMLVVAVVIGVCVYAVFRMPVAWFPALYFVLKYIASQVYDFERVRYSTAFSLCVITALMVVVVLRIGFPKHRGGPCSLAFSRIGVLFACAIALSVCWGFARQNDTAQVIMDSYKFIDIFVMYVLFRFTWRTMDDVWYGLAALCAVMVVLGVVEQFFLDGGVGLNLALVFMPTFLCCMFARNEPAPKIALFVAVVCLFVFACNNRTYSVGFALGLVLVMLTLGPKARFRFVALASVLVVAAGIALAVGGTGVFSGTLDKFVELFTEGFGEAGGYRESELEVAFERILEKPVLGWGLGHLEMLYLAEMGLMEWGSFLHNAFVEILLKTGVVGFGVFMTLLAVFLKTLATYGKRFEAANPGVHALCTGAIIGAVSWLLVYSFAPLNAFGSVFVAPVSALCALYACEDAAAEDALACAGEEAESAEAHEANAAHVGRGRMRREGRLGGVRA